MKNIVKITTLLILLNCITARHLQAQTSRKLLPESSSIAYSEKLSVTATREADNSINVKNSKTGKFVYSLRGHSKSVKHLSISPNEEVLASAGADGTVRTWNLFSGKMLKTLRGHTGDVGAVCFSPDGKLLASSGRDDMKVIIWEVTTGKKIKTLEGHKDNIEALSFDRTGKYLASASFDGIVKIWDTKNFVLANSFQAHSGQVTSLAFNPSCDILASGGTDGKVKFWDSKFQNTNTLKAAGKEQIGALRFSNSGKLLAIGSLQIELFNMEKNCKEKETTFHSSTVNGLAFSQDDSKLFSEDKGFIEKCWDLSITTGTKNITKQRTHTSRIVISPDNKLFATVDEDNLVAIKSCVTNEVVAKLPERDVSNLAFSPDNKKLASVNDVGLVTGWEIAGSKLLFRKQSNEPFLRAISFSPDGKHLAIGGQGALVQIWNSAGFLEKTLPSSGGVYSLTFSRDGTILFGGGKKLFIWNSVTGTLLHAIEQSSTIISIYATKSNDFYDVYNSDGFLQKLNFKTLSIEKRINLEGPIMDVAYNSNGELAVIARNNQAIFFNTSTGKSLKKIKIKNELMAVAMSSDGSILLMVDDFAQILREAIH